MSRLSPIERLRRLDGEIETLQLRLNTKLAERRGLLMSMIEDGEMIANNVEVIEQIRMVQSLNMAAEGRYFTDQQVRDIRAANKSGESQTSIARRYGVSQVTIHKMVTHQSYQDVS
jgi:hypothetical protein